jgi:hypothetical protein
MNKLNISTHEDSIFAKLLATETQKQLPVNELAEISGKLLFQDNETATYFVLAKVEMPKNKKAKSKTSEKTNLFSWETILLLATWLVFLVFVCAM